MKSENICRFCLSRQSTNDFVDINQEKLIGGIVSIREALISCTKLNMTILDCFSVCCKDCLEKVTQIYEFIQKCKNTSWTLLRSSSAYVSATDNPDKLSSTLDEQQKPTESFQDVQDESTQEDHELPSSDECIKESNLEQDLSTMKKLSCRYCKETFYNQPLLDAHISKEHPADRPYTCPICSKGFQSVSNRNTHIQSHNPVESFKCSKCLKTFRSKVYLSKHIKFVHSVSEKQCKICNKTFINTAKYKYHAKSHDTSKQFHCRYCTRSFIQIHHLQNHERTHTGVCPFLCTVCGHRFKAACNLKLHMKTHSNDKKFVCNICSKSFVQQSSYKTHMKGHSGDFNFFQCECGKNFKQKYQLKNHMKVSHTHNSGENEIIKPVKENKKEEQDANKVEDFANQKLSLPYVCTICDKRFKVPSSLLTHSRIHTEDRKYSCDKCNSKFKRREHLRIHVNGVHLKLKPFKCDICARTFSQSGDRNIHMKSHSEEKEHNCTICGKKFRLVKALRTHLRIHTGEKPYCCTFCQQSFMTYMAMAAHTEKCQEEVTAGKLVQTVSDTSNSEKHFTVITLPSTSTGFEIQSIEIPANIVLTVPITQSLNTKES